MLNEIITNAHMAGQRHAGCKHPSWGDALGYSHSVLPGTLERAARQYIEESPENSPASPVQQLKAEISLLIQRTKQCACADDMGSVKGLLEQIDAKLSAV